jgi:hypothetical protein
MQSVVEDEQNWRIEALRVVGDGNQESVVGDEVELAEPPGAAGAVWLD